MQLLVVRGMELRSARAREHAMQSVRFRKSTFPGTACLIQALTFY